MNHELKKYIDSMNLAKTMLKKEIIDQDDYNKIDEKLSEKYCINTNNLYRSIDLIYTLFRGNIRTTQGGINNENCKEN